MCPFSRISKLWMQCNESYRWDPSDMAWVSYWHTRLDPEPKPAEVDQWIHLLPVITGGYPKRNVQIDEKSEWARMPPEINIRIRRDSALSSMSEFCNAGVKLFYKEVKQMQTLRFENGVTFFLPWHHVSGETWNPPRTFTTAADSHPSAWPASLETRQDHWWIHNGSREMKAHSRISHWSSHHMHVKTLFQRSPK